MLIIADSYKCQESFSRILEVSEEERVGCGTSEKGDDGKDGKGRP